MDADDLRAVADALRKIAEVVSRNPGRREFARAVRDEADQLVKLALDQTMDCPFSHLSPRIQ